MMSRPEPRSSAGLARLAASIFALSATVMLGRAEAGPLQAMIDHITGRASTSPPSAVAEARCYGRYVVWRDAIGEAIQATNAWPSAQPANEFYKMQASFVAVLSAERGVAPRISPDLNEADLPADVRLAFEQGVTEAKAKLGGAGARGAPLEASDGRAGSEAMAKAQAAIDGAFAPLRVQCARQVDVHPLRRPSPPRTVARDNVTPTPTTMPAAAVAPGADDAVPGVLAAWDRPKWIQVGVFDRADASGAQLHGFRSGLSRQTAGLSERTEAVRSRGKVQHIAFVGPFSNLPQARAFCDRLTARGGACVVQPPTAPAAMKGRPSPHDGAQTRVADRSVPPARPSRATLISNPGLSATDAGLRGRVVQ